MLTRIIPTPILSAAIITLNLLSTQLCHATSHQQEKKPLIIDAAWIAEAPPTSKVMVGYMIIRNTTTEAIDIISARSDLYSSIEFHETVHENGMARMLRHDSLQLPAQGSVQLKRDGKHLMLFNPKKSLKAGDTVMITFTSANNINTTINVTVKKAQF